MAEVAERSIATDHAVPEKIATLDSAGLETKRQEIEWACAHGNVDRLVELADSSDGLVDDDLRKLAWPLLLGCSKPGIDTKILEQSWQSRPPHRDEEQVRKDADRAFVYYANDAPETVMEARKQELYDLIVSILRCHPMLCYFQGYHDIVQVMMLVLGRQQSFEAVEILSLGRIRDYMLRSLTPALRHLQLIPAILQQADGELATHLSVSNPNYALPSALTLYAHQIQEYSNIVRLFDFLLAHEPVINVYLFAAIILSRREALLEIPDDDPDILFFTLQKLPQPLNLEPLIAETLQLFKHHPPERLPDSVWQRFSGNSVLKTSRDIRHPQSLNLAEETFRRQSQELKWEELKQKAAITFMKHKRPIFSTATALMIGLTSIWLRKSGNDKLLLSMILSGIGALRNL